MTSSAARLALTASGPFLKKALPFAAVVLLPFLLYWKLFHPNPEDRLIFRGDFLNQHYVWKSYTLSRVKAFELPLWNPHILGGEAPENKSSTHPKR